MNHRGYGRSNGVRAISRKHFIGLTAKSMAATALLAPFTTKQGSGQAIKAIAFDAFTLFDTRPILLVAEKLYPGKGAELMGLWRNRQFEYTWLRSLSKNYKDFRQVTDDALQYATASLKLDLNTDNKAQLMSAVGNMRFIPEAGATLGQLKEMRLQLAILSNATPAMLHAAIDNSGLQHAFDFIISTDSIKTYKPDPAAYQLGIDAFKVKKEAILFVAFGGWDAAGAKTFGYPTVWINAGGLPAEQLDVKPDFICRNLTELTGYVKERNK